MASQKPSTEDKAAINFAGPKMEGITGIDTSQQEFKTRDEEFKADAILTNYPTEQLNQLQISETGPMAAQKESM